MSSLFPIAQDGVTDAGLVVSPEQHEVLSFAADELQRYLAILTGAWVERRHGAREIVLSVEPADRETHGWRTTPERLVLHGSRPLGVLHAVYAFLEAHAGCRWLSEFEGGEIVPRLERLVVPCEERVFSPAMTHRAFTNFPDIDRRTVAMVDWMAKQRFNRFMVFANAGDSFAKYEQVLRRELLARHMPVELGHHSFRFFLPPEEFFGEHPEYYALLNGERSTAGQVCTTHPDVAALMAERVCRFFAQYPEIDRIGLWPNDGYGWCECPNCLAVEPQEPSWPYSQHLRRTDTYLQFVNAVAALVAREHPDRRLSALAYVNYVEPPRGTRPASNVDVCYAPFQRCFKHPLAAPPECLRHNARYAELLAEWRAVTAGTLYLFEYLMLVDMLSVPYDLTDLLPQDFAAYAHAGVEGYVLEFKPEEWDAYGVNAHLIGCLSREPETDAAEYLSAYYGDRYGPAAAEMGEYFAALRRLMVDLGPCVGHYDLDYTRRLTEQLLRPASAALGRAMARVAGADRRYRDAVVGAQWGLHLILRLGAWRELVRAAREAPEAKRPAAAQAALAAGQEIIHWSQEKHRRDHLDWARIGRIVSRENEALKA